MNFTEFLVRIGEALQNKDGAELSWLLNPREAHSKSVAREFRDPTVSVVANSCNFVLLRRGFDVERLNGILRRVYGVSMGRNCHTIHTSDQ